MRIIVDDSPGKKCVIMIAVDVKYANSSSRRTLSLSVFLTIRYNVTKLALCSAQIHHDGSPQHIRQCKHFRFSRIEPGVSHVSAIGAKTSLNDLSGAKFFSTVDADFTPCNISQGVCVGAFQMLGETTTVATGKVFRDGTVKTTAIPCDWYDTKGRCNRGCW